MPAPAADIAGLPFGWGAVFGFLNLLGIGGILTAWVKLRPRMRELEKAAEEKLRDDLIARVERLERRLEEERTQHEATMSIMRHRLTNSDQCIEALLLVLDDDDLPPKVKRAVNAIKAMRDRQRGEEALEKATIQAAALARVDPAAAQKQDTPA